MAAQDWPLGSSEDWPLGRPYMQGNPDPRRARRVYDEVREAAFATDGGAYALAGHMRQGAAGVAVLAPPPPKVGSPPARTKQAKPKRKKPNQHGQIAAELGRIPTSAGHDTSADRSVITLRFKVSPTAASRDGPLVEAEGDEGVVSILKNDPHTYVVDEFVVHDDDPLPELIREHQEAGHEVKWYRRSADEWEVVIDPRGNP